MRGVQLTTDVPAVDRRAGPPPRDDASQGAAHLALRSTGEGRTKVVLDWIWAGSPPTAGAESWSQRTRKRRLRDTVRRLVASEGSKDISRDHPGHRVASTNSGRTDVWKQDAVRRLDQL